MSEVVVTWLVDTHECEICGTSWSEGAMVSIDGTQILELRPSAHCYGGESWGEADVFRKIIEALGHDLGETAKPT